MRGGAGVPVHSENRTENNPERPGVRMLGQHELLVRLAAGGAANVFLVRDTKSPPPGRLLALKVLLPSLAANEDFVNMFFTEARIAARLTHPNIVSITGFGQAEGIHCLAMEYVFGASLAQVLRTSARARKPLTVGVLLQIAALVCDALHYAHELRDEMHKPMGLVHRDVTPQNILIGFNGVPKLTDFGIAKATNRGWETQAGVVKGKFSYMSPEQALGKKVDRRSDIFCTGIVLWEALTGKELFKGTSPMEVIDAIRDQPIVPPSKVVPGLSPIVDPIVMRALRRSPRQRYQTAEEMQQDISRLIDRAGVKIDAQTISKELAEIFGETIVERAMALRAAMAGRTEPEELARVLGGQKLREDYLPVIPGGTSHPDPLGLFIEPHYEEVEEEPAAPHPLIQPARVEREFTQAFQAVAIDLAEALEPEVSVVEVERGVEPEELIGFDVDDSEISSTGSGVSGWEDATRMVAPSDELLSMLSEKDVTNRHVPQRFVERFGLSPASDLEVTGEGMAFSEESTFGGGEHPGFDDVDNVGTHVMPVGPAGPMGPLRPLVPPPSDPSADFDVAPPTVPGQATAYRSVSPKKLEVANPDPVAQAEVRKSFRPIPRAPSLDMSETATPVPDVGRAKASGPAAAPKAKASVPAAGGKLPPPPAALTSKPVPAKQSLPTGVIRPSTSSVGVPKPSAPAPVPSPAAKPVSSLPKPPLPSVSSLPKPATSIPAPVPSKLPSSVPAPPPPNPSRSSVPTSPALRPSPIPAASRRSTPSEHLILEEESDQISALALDAAHFEEPEPLPLTALKPLSEPDSEAVPIELVPAPVELPADALQEIKEPAVAEFPAVVPASARMRPLRLLIFAVLFIALGVGLGVLIVKMML